MILVGEKLGIGDEGDMGKARLGGESQKGRSDTTRHR